MGVLVTGGAGYIGSHMVIELLGKGEHVVVLDDLSTGFRDAVPDAAILVTGDVGDAGAPAERGDRGIAPAKRQPARPS